MSEVVNLPTGDARLGDFSDALLDFIKTEGYGLPYPAILGCIEIVKMSLMQQQLEDLS